MSSDETLEQSNLAQARAASLHEPRRPVVPGYELESCLGSGSFGEVWSARQCSTGQEVAIKLLLRGGAAYLERELARLRAVSDHPNVLSLIDANLRHDPPYVVTPRLVRSLESEPDPPVARAEAWLEQALRALEFVHSRGLLHCDLKPANLLVDREEQVRIVDFGQAVTAEEGQVALGTLFYMPPEQAQPDSPSSAGWDVYALGATFYRLLGGQLPRATPEFRQSLSGSGGTRAILQRYCNELPNQELVPLRQLNPRVDPDLAAILEHCLEIDPARRYQTPGAVLADLRNRRGHYPLSCRPHTPAYRARMFLIRNRVLASVAAIFATLLALTVALAFVGVTSQRDRALLEEVRSRERLAGSLFQSGLAAGGMEAVLRLAEASDRSPDRASLARISDPAERSEAEHAVAVRRVAAQAYLKASPHLEWSRPVRLANFPERCLAANGSALLLDQDKVALCDPTGQILRRFPGSSACFDPGGSWLAVESSGHLQVYTFDGQPVGPGYPVSEDYALGGGLLAIAGDSLRKVTGGGKLPQRPETGTELVVSAQGALACFGRGQVQFLPGARTAGDKVVLSPLGPALVLSPHSARLVEPATGRVLWDRDTNSPEAAAACFSPDGQLVAIAASSSLELRETRTGEPQGEPIPTEFTVLDLDFDDSGQVLAGGCSDGRVRLWSRAGFPLAWAPLEHEAPVVWVRMGDRELLTLSSEQDQETLRRWSLPAPTSVLADLEQLPAGLRASEGRVLAWTNTRVFVWSGQDQVLEESLPGVAEAWLLGDRVLALSSTGSLIEWSQGQRLEYPLSGVFQALRPDGRAALVLKKGIFQEVDLASGRILREQPDPGGENPVRYSPDGSWVAAAGSMRDRVESLFRPDWEGFATQVRVMGIAFGPSSSTLLAWTDSMEGSAVVYQSGPGMDLSSSRHATWVNRAIFSPDGRWVLTVSLDGKARALHAQTLQPTSTIVSHGGVGLSNGCFSPDSSRLVTVDEQNRARLWDRATGLPLSPLLPHAQDLDPIFTRNDQLLLTWEKKLIVWDFPPADRGLLPRAEQWTGLKLGPGGVQPLR
ncbi:hypothetical protein DYH09_11630 [bacterium CPR1]|nr:hypothetical protein [bacterium CPR1]